MMVGSLYEANKSHQVRLSSLMAETKILTSCSSRSYLHQMRKLARKSPIAHEILYYLVEHMGRTTNAVVCSYTTLCEITGVSRPTVGRAIKLLKDDQWIDTVKIGNANAYCVNERVFWQAGRNQRKYAIFSATVIASATDQRAISKKKPNRN